MDKLGELRGVFATHLRNIINKINGWLEDLLKKELPWIWTPLVVPLFALLYICWTMMISIGELLVFGPADVPEELLFDDPITLILFMAFATVWVIVEEIFFRVPITVMAHLGKPSPLGQLLFIAALSVGFGSWHSFNTGSEFYSLFVQGFGGLVLGIVYLISGGYKGKLIKPLFITWAVHATMNGILLTIELIFMLIE